MQKAKPCHVCATCPPVSRALEPTAKATSGKDKGKDPLAHGSTLADILNTIGVSSHQQPPSPPIGKEKRKGHGQGEGSSKGRSKRRH